jgi:adenine-specific DNA-methyltransferase
VNFDNTKNIFIEGDNLDALKLLQETYLNKVKMIYIDPPYNTGNDFLYEDNFEETSEEYLKRTNQTDPSGNRMVANLESNGRFHSDWLTMLYSRLKLARNLLRDDGAIFISMDDGEIHNLRKICGEIFGEQNFVATFIWEKRTNRENRKVVSGRHDYVLCFCKSHEFASSVIRKLPMTDKALSNYKNPDNDPRGPWKSDPAQAQAGHGTRSQFYVFNAPNGKSYELESGRCWAFTEPVMQQAAREGRLWFGKNGNGVPRIKTYLDAKERGLTPETIWFAEDVATNEQATNLLKELFGGASVFDTPKPVDLIKRAILLSVDEGIVLDFFAGSGVTAHATLDLNAEDGKKRSFILVQLPELCSEDSEALKLGYKTIADVCKERIRRAGTKVAGITVSTSDLDIGFRVLKIDTSNMKDVYYAPDEVKQDDLVAHIDNIKEDRVPEDLLFQVLVEWGVDLALPIERQTIAGKTVFFVDGNALAACFDPKIDEELVKELAKRQPLRAVFRDSSFDSDSVKINVEQIFKLLSSATEVKSL